MSKKYKKKRLKIPLVEYISLFNIELGSDKKQVYIDEIATNYVACKNGDILSYQTDCKNPIKLKPIIIQRQENNKKSENYNPDLLYRGVNLKVNDKEKLFYVHRIIASAFIPNPENKPEVNHKDGNKGHNNVENLEWVTSSENQIHAFAHDLQKSRKGSKHHHVKINEKIAKEICELIINSDLSLREIASKTKSTYVIVTKINKGQRWKHVSSKFNVKYPLYSNRKSSTFND